jgi:hypothetical protein
VKQDSVDQNATGFSPDFPKQKAKVIPIHPERHSSTEEGTGTGSLYIQHSDVITEHYTRTKQSKKFYTEASFETIESFGKELLNKSFELITDAVDFNLGSAERSNCFDEWKDMLENMARKVKGFTNNHRKILGSLIAATHSSDISNFPIQSLRIFQEATNSLRQPRVSKQDSHRVISNLLKRGIKLTAPLAVDNLDDDNRATLENMMSELLSKSRNGY